MRLSFSFTLSSVIRYTKITVVGLMVAILVALGWFLYQNFYKPLTQAGLVATLKGQVAETITNRRGLEAVLRYIDESKKSPSVDWENLRDPFTAVPQPPPAAEVSAETPGPVPAPPPPQ